MVYSRFMPLALSLRFLVGHDAYFLRMSCSFVCFSLCCAAIVLYLLVQMIIYEYMKSKRFLLSFTLVFLLLLSFMPMSVWGEDKEGRMVVRLETSAGDVFIALSNLTPLHRDNFVKLVNEGFYDGLLFHRVIEGFMIQTGDPGSRNAPKDSVLGEGGPGYTLPAEIVFPELTHMRGAVAAAREPDEVNPEFRSSGSQFYIVWGQKMRPAGMKKAMSYLEERGVELDRFLINDYQMYGGTPHLDGTYTVFGEVVAGMDVVKAIQAVPTDSLSRPLQDVTIVKATVLHGVQAKSNCR